MRVGSKVRFAPGVWPPGDPRHWWTGEVEEIRGVSGRASALVQWDDPRGEKGWVLTGFLHVVESEEVER